jgi:hypothetical protein
VYVSGLIRFDWYVARMIDNRGRLDGLYLRASVQSGMEVTDAGGE